MIKYIIVLLISATFYVLPLEINAQNKSNLPIKQILKVSPIILDIQLKKGHNKYEINIDNLLNAPLGIGANAQTFDPLEDVNDQAIKIQNPLVDWTNIENPNTLINLGQSKTITIDIDVPQNAKDGGYSEVIFLTPIFIGANNPKSPTVLSRIGVLVLANLGKTNYSNLSKKTSIENFKFTNLFYEKLPAKLTFEVKNNYFNHFSAKPFLTLYPLFGKPEVFYLEEKHVLPGQKKNLE